jgi:hypothetical protein
MGIFLDLGAGERLWPQGWGCLPTLWEEVAKQPLSLKDAPPFKKKKKKLFVSFEFSRF